MLDISRIEAIGLDLDDTLWPIWPVIARAEAQMLAFLHARAPAAAACLADQAYRQALRARVLQAHGASSHDVSLLRRESVRLALRDSDEDPALADPAFAVFFECRMQVQLYQDAGPALARLAARFPIVAVSNGNADLDRIGIGGHFVASLSAQAFGVGKPDARIFHAAARAAGVAPQGLLHVGDDPALDVLGALDAGLQTVWVNRDGRNWDQDRHPHASVSNLDELCGLLARPTTQLT